MDFEIADDDVERLVFNDEGAANYAKGIPKIIRRRIQTIQSAPDEREFYKIKSLHFEKLKGNRSHQRSMRLNDQWRLILEIEDGNPTNKVIVKAIEDYH